MRHVDDVAVDQDLFARSVSIDERAVGALQIPYDDSVPDTNDRGMLLGYLVRVNGMVGIL